MMMMMLEMRECYIFLASTSPEVLSAHKAEIWSSLDEKTKSVYGKDYLEKMYDNFQNCVSKYPGDVAPVVTAICSALFSKQVKSRYTVGRGTCILMYILMLLPSWISDRLSVSMSPTNCNAVPAKLQQQHDASLQ